MLKLVTQHAQAGAAIEDVELVAEAHLDTGSVPSIAEILGLRSGGRPAHSPELEMHTTPLLLDEGIFYLC